MGMTQLRVIFYMAAMNKMLEYLVTGGQEHGEVLLSPRGAAGGGHPGRAPLTLASPPSPNRDGRLEAKGQRDRWENRSLGPGPHLPCRWVTHPWVMWPGCVGDLRIWGSEGEILAFPPLLRLGCQLPPASP